MHPWQLCLQRWVIFLPTKKENNEGEKNEIKYSPSTTGCFARSPYTQNLTPEPCMSHHPKRTCSAGQSKSKLKLVLSAFSQPLHRVFSYLSNIHPQSLPTSDTLLLTQQGGSLSCHTKGFMPAPGHKI